MTEQTPVSSDRGHWGSTLGFILAASGSAIGLGNIVKFGASAYQNGGGAFYVPYLVALILVGVPVMVLEFGIGHRSQRAFPQALAQLGGKYGEFVGWWALSNAVIITMYYITLLGWVMGMMFGALGPLWTPVTETAAYLPNTPELPNPAGFFFNLLSTPSVLIFVLIVWGLNLLICARGPETIEKTVKFFVPAMWITMLALVIRGLTLPGGYQGIWYLFTPDFSAMADPVVWRGAFAQIFFSLSLGFGLLTAYASYLPKKADVTDYALQTSLLNCAFEYVAGFAIFSMLFAFAILPKASSISMSFMVIPQGIAQMPGGEVFFGALFFFLLLIAGLSSSVSLIEGLAAALIDKFNIRRWKALLGIFTVGIVGSVAFASSKVIDPGLAGDGTLGLTLLDFFDHWSLEYGLLLVGLAECILLGWVYGIDKWFAESDNEGAMTKALRGFLSVCIRWVAPIALSSLLITGAFSEFGIDVLAGFARTAPEGAATIYGSAVVNPEVIGQSGWAWLAYAAPVIWLAFTLCSAIGLTFWPVKSNEGESSQEHFQEAIGVTQ